MIDSCSLKADFTAIGQGKRLNGRILWMMFAPDPNITNPRVAFAFNRKIGNAVYRNLLRRRIKSCLNDRDMNIRTGRYLIGSRRNARSITYSQICEDMSLLLARAENV